jgi:hypothetical protein
MKKEVVVVRGAIWILVWEDGGKPRETSLGIADVTTEIRTGHLPNTRQKCYSLSNLLKATAYCKLTQKC